MPFEFVQDFPRGDYLGESPIILLFALQGQLLTRHFIELDPF